MKKLLLGAILLTALVGCNGKDNDEKAKAKKPIKTFRIGITQIVKHPSLATTRKGIEDAINASKYKGQVVFDFQNAEGSFEKAKDIAKDFNKNDDVIVAISTPSAQAAQDEIKTKPIFFSAVTNPVTAKLDDDNITGVFDMSPPAEHIKLIKMLLPNVETVGTIYSKNEPNSAYIVQEFTKVAVKVGFKVITKTINDEKDIPSTMDSLAGKVDVLFTPNDNHLASVYPSVVAQANKANLPIIGTNEAFTATGALASSGISLYDVGYSTGEMVVKYLNGTSISDVPVKFFDKSDFVVNGDQIKKYKITLTDHQKSIVKFIKTSIK